MAEKLSQKEVSEPGHKAFLQSLWRSQGPVSHYHVNELCMESESQRARALALVEMHGGSCLCPLSLNSIFEQPDFVTSPGEGCPNRFFQL